MRASSLTGAASMLLGLILSPIAAAAPVFEQDILPWLQQQCVACHMTGDEEGGLALMPEQAYDQLVHQPSGQSPLLRVAPGRLEDSYLLHKLQGTHLDAGGRGARMPLGGAPVPEQALEQVRAWIRNGAPRQ